MCSARSARHRARAEMTWASDSPARYSITRNSEPVGGAAEVGDGDDVRVVEAAGRLGLALEAAGELFFAAELGGSTLMARSRRIIVCSAR